MPDSLKDALKQAVSECWDFLDFKDLEEHGGVILHNKETDKYLFQYLFNSNSGKSIACGLFTADRYQYTELIIPKFKDNWRQYASFHTHPQFTPQPSSIDLNQLFTGFFHNYIYSGLTKELIKYTWKDPKDQSLGLTSEKINLNE
jgi:hypothetical protein